jgi:exodeoxyribonuclease V alpha subunit
MKNLNLTIKGIVQRVTFHSAETGWSVLKVSPFDTPQTLVTVLVHQVKVFAGSTMEFRGEWVHNKKFGDQFKAFEAIEKKPATTAALEKYLGSGLIKGVGPKIAKKIVSYFKDQTLKVFEEDIQKLTEVPGIASKKLEGITQSWSEHKAIRDVVLFLQEYGISSLFAVKIFKAYGDKSISTISQNPYAMARDIYGIGFFSADKIAQQMGILPDAPIRIEAGVKHVLSASREEGHCYLRHSQIMEKVQELLQIQAAELIDDLLAQLTQKNEIKKRQLIVEDESHDAYYSRSLYFDELKVVDHVKARLAQSVSVDRHRIETWVMRYCSKHSIQLSDEQRLSVEEIPGHNFSILTGGPGCGKTTTTKVLVQLLLAMKKSVVLAAPTGRAAQRMSEVIGQEAKTLHRLLEWSPGDGGFKKNKSNPIQADFFIIDESSMLDVTLAASLLDALPINSQLLLIGDPDQLPSVGAGNILRDLLDSPMVPRMMLTKVFRQAEESLIIRYAHQINKGNIPQIESPLQKPFLWADKCNCMFIDSEEVTQEQLKFLYRVKNVLAHTLKTGEEQVISYQDGASEVVSRVGEEIQFREFGANRLGEELGGPVFQIPKKFEHVDLQKINLNASLVEELKLVLKAVHPWSSLHHGKTASDMILHLYAKTIQNYFGKDMEIQVLSPQVRGSLGTHQLNQMLQQSINPQRAGVKEFRLGAQIFREGDRVIQTRNNYDLGVFNGDIGRIMKIDLEGMCCEVRFSREQNIVYEKDAMTDLSLAYAITIHKSQGSEFDGVIIPIASQHFNMLYRNLVYTGLTRAKKLCVFVGSRKALALAIKQINQIKRQTTVSYLLQGH